LEYLRKIALVSDTHVGSRYAIFPEGFYGKEGNLLSAAMNDGQKTLNKYWYDYVEKCDELDVDTVFLVGDMIQGVNRKDFGQYILTGDMDEQVDACTELLKPLCKDRKVGVWSGTRYHESIDYRVHKALAEKLEGIASESRFFGNLAVLKLTPSSRIANVAHGSGTNLIYIETALAKEGFFLKQAEALFKTPKTDILIRGHLHRFVYIHENNMHFVSLPCFQAYIPWATKLYGRYVPDIGGCVLLIDDKNRIKIWHYLYDTVHISDSLVEY